MYSKSTEFVHFSVILRYVSPMILRSSFVHPSFILRLNINNVKKDDAWMNGGTKLQSVTICHGFNLYTHYFAYANSGSEII